MDDELGLVALSDDARAYVNDPNPGIEALEEFLDLLELQTLERLPALMYSGRPGEGSAEAMKKELEGDSKEGIVRTIAEKQMNPGTYFSTALERAHAEGWISNRFEIAFKTWT
jgi:hypothetical protein